MPPRPVLAHVAEHHPAQSVPRRRVDEGQIQVPEQQRKRRVEQSVVEEDRAREAEARVLLPEPEEQTRDEEEHHEGRRQRSVDLLPRVEARLLPRSTPREPVDVLALEHVELARRPQHAAPVAEHRDDEERGHPADAAPEVRILDELPPPDLHREPRDIEDQPGCEDEEEAERVDPVDSPLGLREAVNVPGLHAP